MWTQAKIVKLFLALAILLFVLSPVQPIQFVRAGADRQENDTRELSGGDEDRWEAFFAREMANYDVYGAIMIMVKDGQVVSEESYGYADAASQTPIDPRTTILRAGSVAKTITALAVLQLAEAGQLDLDADVNKYLTAFKVPETFSEPVTARQLINMTGGFDTRWVGIRATSPDRLMPLGDYLARYLPARVLPPGTIRRYNDHELALAGYLVEAISGKSYEAYVRQAIFEPLEMYDSTFLLPDSQLSRAARGYPVGADPEQPYPFSYYYLQDAPGSGFNTTGQDLSHLMLAHLQHGRYLREDGSLAQILRPETMDAMHRTAFAYHPRLAGQANSFDEKFFNGHRYLQKYGGAPGMNNAWLILPDQDLSLYLFYNSEGFGLRNLWQEEALARYLMVPGDLSVRYQPASDLEAPTARYDGLYRKISDETSETSLVKIQALVDPDLTVQVKTGANGSLQIWGRTYSAIEPDLFLGSGPNDLIYFSGEAEGPAEYLFQERTAYQRVRGLENPAVQTGLAGFGIVVFILTILVMAVRLWQRKARGYLLAGLIAGVNLVFLGGLGMLLWPVATGGDLWQFSFPPSAALRLVLFLPLATLPLTAGLLVATIAGWRRSGQPRFQRWFNPMVLAGTAAWLIFLNTWNLLGWRF